MKTDRNFNIYTAQIKNLRPYDDDTSILLRTNMIMELTMQIKTILLMRRHTDEENKRG